MNKFHVISEFGIIRNRADYADEPVGDSFDEIFLPAKAFQNLMRFIAENRDAANGIDHAFSVHLKGGKYSICVKNYVGLIETKEGTSIEILPKIYMEKEGEDSARITWCRDILLRMLRCLKDSPFRKIDLAHLRTTKLPILEIFISLFLEEFELILQRGIKQHYVTRSENKNNLKGRLQIKEQVTQNFMRKQYFFVEFDEFHADIPQNRVLKAALTFINSKSRSAKNRMAIINYLALLDEVPLPSNLEKDLTIAFNHTRLFNYYKQALQWARIFLKGESFTSFKGKEINQAILFPMEQLFESYVADQFRKRLEGWEMYAQDRRYHLVENHNGERKFRIRPDLVITNEEVMVVADTKWKLINQNAFNQNYMISQADMYQLYAYGKKYQHTGKQIKLLLIYPKHASFFESLEFDYDQMLRIDVVPFDFEESTFSDYPCFSQFSFYE